MSHRKDEPFQERDRVQFGVEELTKELDNLAGPEFLDALKVKLAEAEKQRDEAVEGRSSLAVRCALKEIESLKARLEIAMEALKEINGYHDTYSLTGPDYSCTNVCVVIAESALDRIEETK